MASGILLRIPMLEALYECLGDDKKTYDMFCDRLDLGEKTVPYLMRNTVKYRLIRGRTSNLDEYEEDDVWDIVFPLKKG